MAYVQIRGLGAAGPAALAFGTPLAFMTTQRPVKTPTQRERDLEMAIMIAGGLAGTVIGVLYAMDKTKLAGSFTMATGLMGTIYGAIRLFESYDTQIAMEREDAGFVA